MARNPERDAREEMRRRNLLLENGFRMFSERGIENVSLQEVASVSGVGVATLYNYYGNKTNLLVAISAKVWVDFWHKSLTESYYELKKTGSAIERVEYFCDRIIDLYTSSPDTLRFSGNYKTYICREGNATNIAREQLDALAPICDDFRDVYERAKVDGTMRTDIPENEMLTTIALTMLGMAERYAQGIVWADNNRECHTSELIHVKDMIMSWCSAK